MTAEKAKAPTRWAREYETIYILRPNVSSEDAEKVGVRVADVISRLDGRLTQVDHWGRRQLAYKINKLSRGIFVYVKYVAFNDAVAELERNLRLMDEVIRYQTIVLHDRIDPSSVEVDPEAVKFEAIEEEDEPYEEEDLATRLGMARPEPRVEEAPEGEEAKAEGEEAKAEGEEAKAEGEEAKAEGEEA
ncbi:MAG: 30S ribosomal protein S6, partial [Deltaproteobacteria bacterium]|nr:30S ribosomal protein S6 [Deltaproteobacteria bacterium]